MKKLIIGTILLALTSSITYAKSCYTVTQASCKHSSFKKTGKFTQFFILGNYQERDYCDDRYHVAIRNAANSFLKSEYADKVERYCIGSYSLDASVAIQYSKKSKANKQLSEWLDNCMNRNTYAKCVKIKGWNVDEWDD